MVEKRKNSAIILMIPVALLVVSFSFSTTPLSSIVEVASAKEYQGFASQVPEVSQSMASPTPSVLDQGEDVLTAQGSLSLLRVSQSNNIVNTLAFYNIQFKTSTTGVIQSIEMEFPDGTYLGAPRTVEVEGIGKGLPKGEFGDNKLVYVVDEPESVPAGSIIRLEFANIRNPPTPTPDSTVTVTTRNPSSLIIDGPTVSPIYVVKQINNEDIRAQAITANKISPTFMTSRTLQDGQNGWNPDAALGLDTFTITDSAVKASISHVYVSVDEPADVGPLAVNVVCMVEDIENGQFEVVCDLPPADGSVLRYTVINQNTA